MSLAPGTRLGSYEILTLNSMRNEVTGDTMTCSKCGSDKIIPDVPLIERYGDTGHRTGAVRVKVDGDPDAFIFKDRVASEIHAHICGNCGYVELRAPDYAALWEKHEAARG